jgi:hypothetical protein
MVPSHFCSETIYQLFFFLLYVFSFILKNFDTHFNARLMVAFSSAKFFTFGSAGRHLHCPGRIRRERQPET